VVLVVVLGLFVIIYGRQSRPSDGSGVPRVNDGVNTDSHWHAAFGIYICDTFQPKIVGTKEETTTDAQGNTVLADDEFRINGVHSHGDGIIHYHPYSTKSSGNRAKLGVFLDVYDIKLTDTKLVMPPDQGGETWSTDDTKCNGKDNRHRHASVGRLLEARRVPRCRDRLQRHPDHQRRNGVRGGIRAQGHGDSAARLGGAAAHARRL